jgi:6-pyruvoyltetrahydropterin/6-carboxytetrahydropterin synthase
MLITKEIEIDMAHRVPNHKSKCRNLHGHRYKIEVGVDDNLIRTEGNSSEGMVIDYGDLKNIMMEVIDKQFDHNSIFFEQDPIVDILSGYLEEMQIKKPFYVSFIPTAENLAKYWYRLVKVELLKVGIKIKHVKVWETPTSTATYYE